MMERKTATGSSSVHLHKNGVLILKDVAGTLHVFEPQQTLRELAKYVWKEELLKGLRVDEEESAPASNQDVKFVELPADKDERLRSVNISEDPYYQDLS